MPKTSKRRRPHFEGLEDRRVPATWGIPWADPQHLTVSFVPDGTQIEGQSSQLFGMLGAGQGVASGEATILKALQTWAANSNINIGVVPDGGQPIGTAGPAQGDTRFGDIRVGAAPLPAGVLAITSPYDPTTGSLSGDMILNSNYDTSPEDFGSYDLFTVALHESGHVFGFADSTSLTSFMYNLYQGPQTSLGIGAVSALQSLYGGPRSIDKIDGISPGDDWNQAVEISSPASGLPSVSTNGELDSAEQVDYYRFQAPVSALVPLGINVQVQTSGLSLLVPKVTVLDQSGKVVATAAASSPLNGGITVHLPTLTAGALYTIEVRGATGDVMSVGSYQLNVMATIPTAANSSTPTSGARSLPEPAGYIGSVPLVASAPISQSTQADVYSFKTLASNPSGVMVDVQAWGIGLSDPTVTVYNSAGSEVGSSTAITSGSAVAVSLPTVQPYATYYVRVDAGTLNGLSFGTYQISVAFAKASPGSLTALPAATQWLGTGGLSNVSNGSLATAAPLTTPTGLSPRSHYVAIDSVGTAEPQRYYEFSPKTTPSNAPEYATVSVQTLGTSALLPWISAFDKSGNALASKIFIEQGGIEVVQISLPNSVSQDFLEVSAARGGGQAGGDYVLNLTFGTTPSTLPQLATGTLASVKAGSNSVGQSSSLTISQTELYSFVLQGSAANSGTDAILRMTLTDSSGNVVATLTTPASQAESMILCLGAGTYTILIDAYSPSGAAMPSIYYVLDGTNLTDPIKVQTTSSSGSGSMGGR